MNPTVYDSLQLSPTFSVESKIPNESNHGLEKGQLGCELIRPEDVHDVRQGSGIENLFQQGNWMETSVYPTRGLT